MSYVINTIADEIRWLHRIGFTPAQIDTRLRWIAGKVGEGVPLPIAINQARDKRESTDPYFIFENAQGNVLELPPINP